MTDRLVIVFTLDLSREITHRDLIRLHDLKRKKKAIENIYIQYLTHLVAA